MLFGDSTPSQLNPTVLDDLSRLLECAHEVAIRHVEAERLENNWETSARRIAVLSRELEHFAQQAEIGLTATSAEATSPELPQYANEAVTTIKKLADGWIRKHERTLENERQRIGSRMLLLRGEMMTALERLLVPLRTSGTPKQTQRTLTDDGHYSDQIAVELLPELVLELELLEPTGETPLRGRSIWGKGAKLPAGIRRGLLRRGHEPLSVVVDEYALLEYQFSGAKGKALFAKRADRRDGFSIEFGQPAPGETPTGRLLRVDGEELDPQLPNEDRPMLTQLWKTLHEEFIGRLGGEVRLLRILLSGTPIQSAAAIVDVLARLIDLHRPIVAKIAHHSPNPDELTLKLETSDGRRTEAWVRRSELSKHFEPMSGPLRTRFGIAELMPKPNALGPATTVDGIVDFGELELEAEDQPRLQGQVERDRGAPRVRQINPPAPRPGSSKD